MLSQTQLFSHLLFKFLIIDKLFLVFDALFEVVFFHCVVDYEVFSGCIQPQLLNFRVPFRGNMSRNNEALLRFQNLFWLKLTEDRKMVLVFLFWIFFYNFIQINSPFSYSHLFRCIFNLRNKDWRNFLIFALILFYVVSLRVRIDIGFIIFWRVVPINEITLICQLWKITSYRSLRYFIKIFWTSVFYSWVLLQQFLSCIFLMAEIGDELFHLNGGRVRKVWNRPLLI